MARATRTTKDVRSIDRIPLGHFLRDPDQRLELTEEQTDVLARLRYARSVVLDGPSGSGKTHLAASLATAYAKDRTPAVLLAPSLPLTWWLRRELECSDVRVMTIDECAQRVFNVARRPIPPREPPYDQEYFEAARKLVGLASLNCSLVVVDEWQATNVHEQRFLETIALGASFVRVQDSSRDTRAHPPPPIDDPTLLSLSRSMRAPDLECLDAPYVDPSVVPFPTSREQSVVSVTYMDDHPDPHRVVPLVVEKLIHRGFGPGEIGLVSLACPRMSFGALLDMRGTRGRRPGTQLDDPWSMGGFAGDSVTNWAGLERRAIVVADIDHGEGARRKLMHAAISRACEEVHFVLSREEGQSDGLLSAWARVTAERKA